jgi:hypothetical protein
MTVNDAFMRLADGGAAALGRARPALSAAASAAEAARARLAPPARAALARLWRSLRAEPLAHFLAIGLALFAADRLLSPEEQNPRLIRVDDAVYGKIVDIFAESRGRPPTAEEMAPLIDRWIMNETLYREALALGLDRGDDMIRERVMQKMRVLIHSGIEIDPPEERVLRAWFEENRDRYADPALLSIRIARVDGTEAEARAAAEALNADDEAAGLRVYPYADRPREAMIEVFGARFIEDVEALEPGRWSAVETPGGWQAAILDAYEPGREARFEEAANAAAADWTEQTFRATARRSLEALMAGYEVAWEPYEAAAFADRAAKAAAAAEAAGGDDRARAGVIR